MSLENAIAELTKAVKENTAAVLGGAAPAKSTGKAPAKSTDKTTKKKNDGPSVDDLADAFGNYMKGGSKADREEAKANVKKIVDHFEAPRITEMAPENFAEALKLLEQYKDGEDPLGEEEEEDDNDLM